MTAKHTPGPWIVDQNERESGRPIYVFGDAREVANCRWRAIDSAMDLDQALTNARLIAAAPDLLEACRILDEAPSANNFEGFNRAVKAARAAIAKATGAGC